MYYILCTVKVSVLNLNRIKDGHISVASDIQNEQEYSDNGSQYRQSEIFATFSSNDCTVVHNIPWYEKEVPIAIGGEISPKIVF